MPDRHQESTARRVCFDLPSSIQEIFGELLVLSPLAQVAQDLKDVVIVVSAHRNPFRCLPHDVMLPDGICKERLKFSPYAVWQK